MRVLSLFILVSMLMAPLQTRAASETLTVAGKKTVIVAKAAGFGLGGGLVIGLASQVFKKKTKNIFMFGSLGMYAGIGLGLYVVSAPRGATPYEGPDTYEDYGDYQGSLYTPETKFVTVGKTEDQALLGLNLFSMNF